MRENLIRNFLYFSPSALHLGRKERHIGFVESNYMSTMGALNATILRQKNTGNDLGFIKNHRIRPVSTGPPPTCARMIIFCIHTGTLLFIIGYFLDYRNTGSNPQRQNTAERITENKDGAYPREKASWIQTL